MKLLTMFMKETYWSISKAILISYRKKNNNLREFSPNAFAFNYR